MPSISPQGTANLLLGRGMGSLGIAVIDGSDAGFLAGKICWDSRRGIAAVFFVARCQLDYIVHRRCHVVIHCRRRGFIIDMQNFGNGVGFLGRRGRWLFNWRQIRDILLSSVEPFPPFSPRLRPSLFAFPKQSRNRTTETRHQADRPTALPTLPD